MSGEPITEDGVNAEGDSGNSSEAISPEDEKEIDKNIADSIDALESGDAKR